MAKKVNKKKRKQRIIMLIGIGTVSVFILVSLLTLIIRSLFISKQSEQPQSQRIVATEDQYADLDVDEVGEIPVLMYHGIHDDISNNETEYIGGNVDYDGYQRTGEAFRKDLDFYYENNYRCIRLSDYADGYIDCDAGTSPLVLTFDDGLDNNCFVTGVDENGELIIDPGSAVGIMEEYKKKYPDMNITATFFVTEGKFFQPEYNDQILEWLVNHGYDVGNHTKTHVNFDYATNEQAEEEVGYIYNMLDGIIPEKYVNIIALPYGSPGDKSSEVMKHIYQCTFDGKEYATKAALLVGWKANESPFHPDFSKEQIKRIRAYDNNGEDFDIEYSFRELSVTRYISDGDPDTVVVRNIKADQIDKSKTKGKKVIIFE
ncbi:MAG: polysaccharide deacetylase family protein [Bacillota bacterium]|nr:polysaccharide deacetylase family protein [Bacillota bacterium]